MIEAAAERCHAEALEAGWQDVWPWPPGARGVYRGDKANSVTVQPLNCLTVTLT